MKTKFLYRCKKCSEICENHHNPNIRDIKGNEAHSLGTWHCPNCGSGVKVVKILNPAFRNL